MVFEPRPLPAEVAGSLRARLGAAHRTVPFSTTDPRHTVRRVREITADLGLDTRVFRGGVDLGGVEVDHVWIAVAGHVVDVAFPLFADSFVTLLREFVAGDASSDELEQLAEGIGVDARVLGIFPPRVRYLGRPVWRSR